MSFISTNRNDRDRIGLGSHGYGGIRFSSVNFSAPNIFAKERYIPEHNLARFWETPYLEPHEVGFSQPLLRMRDLGDDSFNFLRPPGTHRADQPAIRLKRRNLLTGAAHVTRNDSHIPLWLVDESTNRSRIYNINIGFELTDEGKPSIAMEKYNSIATECTASSNIVQLRTLKGLSNEVAARTITGLELCGPNMEQPQMLFNQYADDLLQIPYMEDEIVICDRMGLVWHGKIGEPLGRVKHFEDVKNICATDCPRVILAGGSFSLSFCDLREHPMAHSHGNVLCEFDDFFPELDAIQDPLDVLRNPMTICHVAPIPGQPNYTMVTTERFHYVLDYRSPKKPLLEMTHSCYGGGDFVTFGATYIDRSRATEFGRPPVIMPYYSMNLAVKPSLQLWSLYFHPSLSTFSSLGPPKQVHALDSALSYVKYHGEGRIPNKARMGAQTFSMHHCAVGDEDAFLFRLSDGGVLWSDIVTIKDMKEDRKADAEVVVEFYEEEEAPICEKELDPEFLRPTSTAVTLMNCELELDSDSDEENTFVQDLIDREVETGMPFKKEMTANLDTNWNIKESDVIKELDEDHIISNIVLNMWNKMDHIVKRDDNDIAEKNGELYFPPMEQESEDPLSKLYKKDQSKKSENKVTTVRKLANDAEEIGVHSNIKDKPQKSVTFADTHLRESNHEKKNVKQQPFGMDDIFATPSPIQPETNELAKDDPKLSSIPDSIFAALGSNGSLETATQPKEFDEDEYDFDVDLE
ncbi:hypothetical protein QR680_000277 [Steinernema hermaphroditum]|uniref:Uncharacterized protein n=1 Tax=Steinernema hermaphroditum TaxID=289476 RepID=A0AA39GU90_9BILA|nr:hypothetical protein QR680_000277 [Steinernema hermaphroditum]